MLSGLIILCGFYLLGEFVATLFQWPIPGSILGMLLLFVALVGWGLFAKTRLISAEPTTQAGALHQTAKQLLPYLPLFIVPASVGILNYGELLQREGIALLCILVVSLFVGIPVCGWIMQRLIQMKEARHD